MQKTVQIMLLVLGTMVARGAAPSRTTAAETAEALLARSRASLAQLDGELSLSGLREPVEVLRDRWGVPHIYAQNADDLFFAQGLVAAQDRLFQMDLWRRIAVGQCAEVLGEAALHTDRFARLVKFRGDMEAEWTSYSPDARQIAAAFTRGINAYIDSLGERLPVEFQLLGYRPHPWQPEDVLGRMSGIVMARNLENELKRAHLIRLVGVEHARRLAPTDPPIPYAPAEGLNLEGLDATVLADYERAVQPFDFARLPAGSNNWVIDGTLSASGKPMLANDPHRAITLPALRYLVHLHAPGWNVIGGGEPGLPGVAIGHNEHVAWGMTIVGNDQADLYVEEVHPADRNRYRAGDRWEPFVEIRESIPVRGQPQPRELVLRFTRHGPVIAEDAQRHRAYVLKWAGQEPGTAGYLGSLALGRAQNWDQFRAAVGAWKLPSENLIYADTSGNIGWIASALTPVRQGYDGLLPVPGADGQYAWKRFLTVDQYPQVFNPPRHYVATANHNILPPGYPHPIAYEWASGHRFQRAVQRLEAQSQFTLDDFRDMQYDNVSLPGRVLARLARGLKLDDPELQKAAELVAAWDGNLSADSLQGPWYAVWLDELVTEFYRPRVPKEALALVKSLGGVPVVLPALEQPTEEWFGPQPVNARDELLRATFQSAARKVRQLLSAAPSPWTWGRLHQTTFKHPLAVLGPQHALAFNLGPLPRGGDLYCLNNTRHNDKFEHIHGASFREVFDLADWDRGLATSVPGQSGQPGSPHYDDLLLNWHKGEYFPLAFSRAKVEAATAHRLLLRPQ